MAKPRHMQAISAFGARLEEHLLDTASRATSVDDHLLDALQTHIQSLSCYCQKPSHASSGRDGLDKLGTSIWNLSARLVRDLAPAGSDSVLPAHKKLALYSRIFALQLLDVAHNCTSPNLGDKLRLMRLALKAGKTSIESSELEMASFALQRAADYVAFFTEHPNGRNLADRNIEDVKCTEAEYYILRTALAWKEGRIDVAEHLYQKGHLTGQSPYSDRIDMLADVLHEMGRDMLAKKDFPMAAKWLERAYDVIAGHSVEELSREALELRLAIMYTLILALIDLGSAEGLARSRDLIHFLQTEMGSTMAVMVLKLELLTTSPAETFDSDAYAEVLSRMISCFCQNDPNTGLAGQPAADQDFKLIMHHAGKLHDKSPALAAAVLDKFLSSLAQSEHEDWIERLVTRRIWMATVRCDSRQAIETAEITMSRIQKPLSSDAAIAVQTLIWKSLESAYSQQHFDAAELWCKLALHRILGNSGPLNRAKIERKHLLCALAGNDFEGARSIYHAMAEESQRDQRTLYLMYKISVRSDDRERAARCLEEISKTPQPLELLYACCLDAQEAMDKGFAIEALRRLLDQSRRSSCSSVHLPALLRCTVRLLAKDLETQVGETVHSEAVKKLCEVFGKVVSHIECCPKDSGGVMLFNANELDWFARNAYNLGIKHLEAWDVSHTIQLLTACNAIMSHFAPGISSDLSADISLKRLFNDFIVSSALISRARAAERVENQLQDYLMARQHIAAFDAALPSQLDSFIPEARSAMFAKLAALLTFDFESALALKDYDGLCSIVLKAGECRECRQSVTALQAMADSLLRSPSCPAQVAYSILRSIINTLWSLNFVDLEKLALYMRCLLQIALPFDETRALALLGEYVQLMTKGAKARTRGLPLDETEWLATTAFNHAVDCYYDNRDESCRQWAFGAFELANLLPNGNQLSGVLHERFNRLRFEVS